jgi:hypothetical protein
MHRRGIGLGTAKATGKVPVVDPFRQGGTTLPSHVFAHLVLAGLKQAIRMLAINTE